MKPVAGTCHTARPGGCGGDFAPTALELFVAGVYSAVDAAAGRELVRLRQSEGILPSCKPGCCNCCCGQHIQTNIAEAHALGRFIKRNFSPRQIVDLKQRTIAWQTREAFRRGRPGPAGMAPTEASEGAACCPLLVDRMCSAYPARPIICRTHFVSSDPSACRPPHEIDPDGPAPQVFSSVIAAGAAFSLPLRAHIEKTGRDYSRTIKLLPHWLAIEMGWGAAVRT